jgi:hypothetical protein
VNTALSCSVRLRHSYVADFLGFQNWTLDAMTLTTLMTLFSASFLLRA